MLPESRHSVVFLMKVRAEPGKTQVRIVFQQPANFAGCHPVMPVAWPAGRADQLAAAGAVTRAREYIDTRVGSNPSLEEIALAAGMSLFHLLRQFKAAIGLPPHAYLMQRRVDQARRLMLKGHALRDVAIRVGYADQAHFSREFPRFYGVAPSTVR